MIFQKQNYREILQSEFEERRSLNPSFSLRAFAKKLALPSSTFSDVINGKQGLSRARANQIAQKLDLSKIEKAYFLNLVEKESSRSPTQRQRAQNKVDEILRTKEKQMLEGQWDLISKWYFPAILELSKTKDFRSDSTWISKKLGISAEEVNEAIEKLCKLSLLSYDSKRKLKPTGKWLLLSPDEIPSKNIKQAHFEIMQKALKAMFLQPLEKRHYNALLLPLDPKQIPKAKKLIQDFNRKFNQLMESKTPRAQVFCFSSQFFCIEESFYEE